MTRPQWRMAGASVRGSSHENAGLPCQDAHLWTITSAGLVVGAVADGAGCASYGDLGATVAVSASVEAVSQTFAEEHGRVPLGEISDEKWQQLLTETLEVARNAVQAEAKARSLDTRDLASTLILFVASSEFIAGVQIGDGAIVAVELGGRAFCVTQPLRGEYLNETVFLTSDSSLATAQPTVWRGELAHLGAISDGLQMVALNISTASPHTGFFMPLFGLLEKEEDEIRVHDMLVSFLTSPRLRERTDDDVTLLLATLIR